MDAKCIHCQTAMVKANVGRPMGIVVVSTFLFVMGAYFMFLVNEFWLGIICGVLTGVFLGFSHKGMKCPNCGYKFKT